MNTQKFTKVTFSITSYVRTVLIRIVAAATIKFRLLFGAATHVLIEGGSYSRAATTNFVRARAPLRYICQEVYYIVLFVEGSIVLYCVICKEVYYTVSFVERSIIYSVLL